MRRVHGLALVLTSVLVVAQACVTPSELKEDPPNKAVQPIVTPQGRVSDAIGDKLLVSAAGAETRSEQAHLERLIDGVRVSLSSPLTTGNDATILVDGPETFLAIEKAITQAKHHVHVETYIFADDPLGRQFAQLLSSRSKQGIAVKVIYDAVGSIDTPQEFFDALRADGVEVAQFRPLNPAKSFFWRFHNRDHRKLIIVDGKLAFTGGMNISNAYSLSSTSKPGPEAGLTEGWRDTQIKIAGPVVAQFQRLFLDEWVELGGRIDGPVDSFYPVLGTTGEDLASAVGSSGAKQQDEAIYQTYMAAIRNSSKRIWITQAYFLPPADLRDALIDAVKRGVDVRIVVPGFTDSKVVLHAARHEYEALLSGGIRLVESQHALLHAKTALIDDALVIIGSANLDYRSFLHNNEVTAVLVGEELGRRMRAIFETDLARGSELTLVKWRKRSMLQRTQESLSSLFKFWL